MKRIFLCLAFLLTGVLGLYSLQGQTLSGVVTDRATGETLPGANIIVQGTTQGTVTDLDGQYSLSLEPGSFTITFRFLGYASQSIEVSLASGEQLLRNVQLAPEVSSFDEVVVVGYGAQQKRVITGSIASVSSEDITAVPIVRIDQALQGRTAGVQVTNMSGQPGEAPTVRIRGAGTTGNAEPLYIVDGLAVSGIEYLNPGDIESIDVLKDAASAAIYGARAANGVVLITTREGTKGAMQVGYSGYHGIQNAVRNVQMLDAEQYRILMNEGARNAGIPEPFDLNEIPRFNTNWQDELFQRNVPMLNHEITIDGGSERSTYASSITYFSQQGIIGGDRSHFERITARLNTTHEVNDFFHFGNNLAYTHLNRRGIASNASFNAAYSSALNLDPLTPVYQDDQNILSTPPYSTQPVVGNNQGRIYAISNHVGAEIVNPLALMEIQTARGRSDMIVGNVFGEIIPIEGLRLRSSLGIDLTFGMNNFHQPLFYLNGAQYNTTSTTVSNNIDRMFTWQWENTISYSRQFGDHNFSALGGMTAHKETWENVYGFNSEVPINDPNHVYLNLATGSNWRAYGGAWHASLLSQFGRILYDYQGRYAFTGIIRRDGSSKFGANNRYGIFPSIGVSWILSEENFFPELGQIDIIKLRASWGINGNDKIGLYQFVSSIDKSRGYIFGDGRVVGASPSFIENADIRWEQSEQYNFALDMGAFNNRLTATIDLYEKTTEGLLERIPIPAHVGNDPPIANVGSVRNRGIELAVNWRNNSRNFRYLIGFNGTYNQNRVTKVGNAEGILPGATWAVAGFVTRSEVGYPIAYFWGFKTDGIFQNQQEIYQHIGPTGSPLQPNAKPGDVRFVDVNGDGVINALDRTMIGSPTPDFTLGMNGTFNYRQFDLGYLVVGAFGHEIFNGMHRQDLRFTNRSTAILDRWRGEGTSNAIPRYTWLDTNNNYRVSDLYIEDGSYIRLKNLQLGYRLPAQLLQRIRSSSLRVYVSVENLITLTRYTGPEPEIGAMSPFDIGIDRGVYPQARTYRIGTSISF